MKLGSHLIQLEGINWWGWSNSKAGYGIVNLEYATAIQRLGIDVTYGWERKEHMLSRDFESLTMEQQRMLEKPFILKTIGVIKTTPELFYQNKSVYRIGYTMVENTRIGEKWINWCNEMDAMFVPSEFLIQVFKNSGLIKPVKVVKQGIDSLKFPYFKRRLKDKNEPFIFGTVGYMDDRKNWQDMVVAFASEFDKNEKVELWIKNSNGYFIHTIFQDNRIRLINTLYSFSEIQRLYPMFDAFLCPSHAEGSGLPPREAMATGLPTILTDWSGLSEICNPKFNYPLQPISIDHPDVRGPEQPGYMAKIDARELMYWMRHIYENRQEAMKKGELASKYIHENWNWNICAKDLLVKLGELLDGIY